MTPSELLDTLLQRAAQANLNEGQLAEQAGLTAQGLSKAKTRGDLRVSTLEALGRALGLELTWGLLAPHSDAIRQVRAGQLFRLGSEPKD